MFSAQLDKYIMICRRNFSNFRQIQNVSACNCGFTRRESYMLHFWNTIRNT